MAWQQIYVHRGAPAKPAFGAPCNGCGVCCLVAPCPLGMMVSRRRSGACKALHWSDAEQRYQCGLLMAPQRLLGRQSGTPRWLTRLLGRWVRRWIAAGQGCDATWQPERDLPV
ncbi:hypothetical protein [Variovorax sp. HJSM1_2]|uniref:hypothetical protein n=1 Tax=Variovorax sp. HJSM1_2 TaxID=3366263 RepID=UPI003BDE0812